MKCSAENEKRITTFAKGSTILKEWIEESNAALGEVDVKKTQLQSEIDSLRGSFHASEDASFEDVVAQDEGDEDISVEITIEEEPEAPAAETTEEHTEE